MISETCTKRFGIVLILLLWSLMLLSCGGGGDSGSAIPPFDPAAPSSTKAITAFSFTSSHNPVLSANATGVISGTNITVTLPYGVSRTSLIATFATNGDSVRIGTAQQTSGFTANNFSNPVTYTVVAEDDTEENYIVTVTNAPNTAKDITAFSFTDAANSELSQDVIGTISGTNIYATVPNGTSRGALVATFSTTGQSVRVGSTAQQSGTTANDFTGAVVYRVTAQDASTKDYTVTVSESPVAGGAIVAGHLAAGAFPSIPTSYINAAKANLHIAYGHTSHGTQLITGMNALASANSLYAWNNGGTGGALDLHDDAMGGDVGYYPDWVNNTRSYLGSPNASGRGSSNPDVNVIIWSWCGQVSNLTQQNMVDQYLAPMAQLESEYWGVRFVYMTGHLDGGGASGNLHLRNQQIRDYCLANNKILFDFADIESYDPGQSTNYMLLSANDNCDYDSDNNGSRDRNWATAWVTANPGDELTSLANDCSGCAHSQGLNCALKGRAAWWLWARLAGWIP